jgi:hypothetical protein
MKRSHKSLLISLIFAIAIIVSALLLRNDPAAYWVYSGLLVSWIATGNAREKRKACSSKAKEL